MRQSDSIAKIAPAIVAASAELHNIAKDAKGAFGGYTTLAAMVDGTRETLVKHNLVAIQDVSGEDGVTVTTRLQHTSGEYIESCGLTLPLEKRTAQGAGSAITYGRRYSLAAMLGISAKDDDDDGREASGVEAKPKAKPKDAKGVSPAELRERTWGMLLEIATTSKRVLADELTVEAEARDLLAKATGFKDKDTGEIVPGKTDIAKVSDKQIPVTYGKVKEKYIERFGHEWGVE